MITKFSLWLDSIFFTLLKPELLGREIRKNKNEIFFLSFTVPLVVIFFEIIASEYLKGLDYLLEGNLAHQIFLSIAVYFFNIFVLTSFLDGFLQLQGHKGRYLELISIINFSFFPKIFFLPVLTLFVEFNFRPTTFYNILSLGFFIWSTLIVIQNLSKIYSFSLWKSFLFLFLPKIIIGFLFILVILFFIINLFSSGLNNDLLNNLQFNFSNATFILFIPSMMFASEVAKDKRK